MEPRRRPVDSLEAAPTRELIQEAIAEARELVALEVKLAREDVKQEVARLRTAAVGFGMCAAFVVLAIALLAVAGVLELGGLPILAVGFGAGFLVAALISAIVGYTALPKRPLERTRERVRRELVELREHVA